jgi:hypothetical protein
VTLSSAPKMLIIHAINIRYPKFFFIKKYVCSKEPFIFKTQMSRICKSNYREKPEEKFAQDARPRFRAQALISKIWPDNFTSLSVGFSDTGYSAGAHRMPFATAVNIVKEVLRREYTGVCGLEFVFGETFRNCHIRVTFDPTLGSWSCVGADSIHNMEEPSMNLAWLDDESSIIHEFGHALGLVHEHLTDKFPYVFDRDHIIEDLSGPPNSWSQDEIELNVFNILKDSEISAMSSAYDKDSVMGYSFPESFFVNGPVGGIERGRKLSDLDKSTLAKLYPIPSVLIVHTAAKNSSVYYVLIPVCVVIAITVLIAMQRRRGGTHKK